MLETILAKNNPPETLISHTKNALHIWIKLKENYQKKIPFNDEFWFDSFISVLFHDAGKIIDNFKEMLKGNIKNNIRHEFISGMILLISNLKYYQQNPLALSAIVSHHRKLMDDLFDEVTDKKLIINKELIIEFFSFANMETKEFWKKVNLNDDEINKTANYFEKVNINTLYSNFKTHFMSAIANNTKKHSRTKYIFLKAILNISDWISSGHDSLNLDFNYSFDDLKHKIIKKLIKENKIKAISDFQFRTFQLKVMQSCNIIAIAPTGSGKTEAALIWASQKDNYCKIIYLLPTRVTSNAIFKRFKEYFEEKDLALVHSSAYFLRKELNDGDYESIKYLKDKTFMRNITVSTIDQILTMGFNLGYWEIKTFNLLNARVIIDEIHLYEPYTLALIISTIKYLQKEFNTQFFIMTATMPKKLKELLLKSLNQQTLLIEDNELLNQSRNRFEIRGKTIDELDKEIKAYLKQNKKVLIVVNTVDEAIRLYEKYKKYKPLCYHSKFIHLDKMNKEKSIFENEQKTNEGILLITTQVIEVSLDIDYDVLFTENAPIDSIIQRAGRINRSRKKHETKIIVYPHREIVKKYIYPTEKILENTFDILKKNNGKNLTEKNLLIMVDEVYQNINIELVDDYKKGLLIYEEIQKQNHFIKDLVQNENQEKIYTREGLDTVDIIPFRFLEQLQDSKPEEKSKYEVSVRKWQYLSKPKKKDNDGFIFLDVNYNSDTGLNFKGRKQTEIIT